MARSSFRWTDRSLFINMPLFEPKVRAAINATVRASGSWTEGWMKIHAPWSDRTGAARSTLTATTTARGNQHGTTYEILLAHGMPYGIWLEVRWSGKYGILPDALRTGGQYLMSALDGLFRMIP